MFLCINWEAVAAYSPLATCFIALGTAIFGIVRYCKDIKFSREAMRNRMLAEYNQRYSQNTSIQKVVKALMKDNFEGVEAYDAEMFMRFFEELQLLIKSDNKMKKEIACYMFSYYANKASKSDKFKEILDGMVDGDKDHSAKTTEENNAHPNNQITIHEIDSDDWALFNEFVAEMKETHDNLFKNEKITNLTI